MRRWVAVLIALAAACSRERAPGSAAPSATASAAPSGSSRREAVRTSRVEVGMSEEQVFAIAGRPDDVRREDGKRPWIVGATEAWAYGSRAPDSFAFGGVVLFDASKKVMMVRSPLDLVSVRAKKLRWSDVAVVDDRGLSCHLSAIEADGGGIGALVTLKNDGAAPFERRHGHTGIQFDLMVELYDEAKRLLAREDTLSLFSPYEQGETAVMRIPAGGSISDRVRLGGSWIDLGKLPAGRYLIRVAFPFEVGRFSVSEPVAFTIAG